MRSCTRCSNSVWASSNACSARLRSVMSWNDLPRHTVALLRSRQGLSIDGHPPQFPVGRGNPSDHFDTRDDRFEGSPSEDVGPPQTASRRDDRLPSRIVRCSPQQLIRRQTEDPFRTGIAGDDPPLRAHATPRLRRGPPPRLDIRSAVSRSVASNRQDSVTSSTRYEYRTCPSQPAPIQHTVATSGGLPR